MQLHKQNNNFTEIWKNLIFSKKFYSSRALPHAMVVFQRLHVFKARRFPHAMVAFRCRRDAEKKAAPLGFTDAMKAFRCGQWNICVLGRTVTPTLSPLFVASVFFFSILHTKGTEGYPRCYGKKSFASVNHARAICSVLRPGLGCKVLF